MMPQPLDGLAVQGWVYLYCKTLVKAMEGTIGISNRIENDAK